MTQSSQSGTHCKVYGWGPLIIMRWEPKVRRRPGRGRLRRWTVDWRWR